MLEVKRLMPVNLPQRKGSITFEVVVIDTCWGDGDWADLRTNHVVFSF